MTDYRFDGLAPRTFEHFVQALCVKTVTKTVTPFGDGPDGGREATFDGPTNYGVGTERWDGYGVVQAKFLQRPTNSTNDGRWVLKQLKGELEKYKDRASERKIDYYILATNVALTSVAGSGSKDKVFAELRRFAKKHGLKAIDVWDYDKLRILLDNYGEVRRSYAAWITPGDVLADLAEALKPQRQDFHHLIVNFLQKELVADQFAKLEQAGHSADDKIPLSQVFVDVPVAPKPYSEPPEDTGDQEKSFYFADLVIRDASLHCGEDDRQHSVDLPPKAIGRHVLIGGPGQGKTTVGQYICQVFRAALLADVRTAAVDPEALTIVRAIRKQWDDGVLARPGARRIPFRVVLSEFAKSLADGQTHGLMAYLTSLFNTRTNADLKVSQFQALLTVYPSILILDGLDEVPASTNRSQVLGAIKEFWADIASSKLTDSGIDVLVVATSRPQGYNEDFSSKFYSHHWMVPLSPAQAIEYGNKLAEVRFGGDTDRVAKVQRRIGRAADNSATARLMRTPLQVTILTLLLDRMGQPPQERWPLFDEYFKLIYQREIERDIPAAAILRNYRSNIVAVHRQVGLLLQVEGERSGGTDARLTVEQFREVVEHHLRDEGHEGEKLNSLTNSIIDAAAHRLVFLVGLELGQVGFEIRSLQEFMAAEGLMAADDKTTQDRLKAVAGNTNWRNVFLFAAGKCFSDRQYLRDTLHTVCGELNDHPDDPTARLTLAGSELALELLEEGSVRRQPKWNRMLTRTALRLLHDQANAWPQRLAEVWHPDTSDVFVAEIRARIEGGEPVPAQNAWVCLTHLAMHAGAEFTDLLTDLLATRHIGEHLFQELLYRGGDCAPLSSFLGAAVLNYPAEHFATACVMSFMHTENGRWSYPGGPEWMKPLAEFFGRRYRPGLRRNSGMTQILFGHRPVVRVAVEQVVTPPEYPWELGSVPAGDHGWSVVSAFIDFLNSPNKEALGRALRLGGANPDEEVIYWLAANAPWPLSEATLAALDSHRWEDLANAAETGLLGDTDDWIAWQKGWLDRGMTTAKMIEGDVLNAGLSGRRWSPVRAVTREYAEPIGEPLDELVEAVNAFPAGPGREFFAQMAAEMILKNEPRPRSLAQIRPDFLETIFGLSWLTGLQCLLVLLPDGLADRRWLTLLADSGRDTFSEPHGHMEPETTQIVQRAWLSAPDLKGLLVPLSVGSVHGPYASEFVTKVRALDVSADPEQIKMARLVLLLRGGHWDDTMEDQGRELITDNPDSLQLFAQAVDLSSGSLAEDETMLLRLHRIAGASGVLQAIVVGSLRRRMRSRQSPLTTAVAWTRLGFPPELSRLIEPHP